MKPDTEPIKRLLPARDARVYVLGDCHIGAADCDMDALKKFIDKVKNDKDAYLVVVGDVLQNSLKSSIGSVYVDQTAPPSGQKEIAYELLLPVKDKILAAVGGNHEARSLRDVDDDPLYDVFAWMQIQDVYRRNMAFLRLRAENGNVFHVYNFLLMHGKSENKQKQYAYAFEGVDVYCTGHVHNGKISYPAHMCFTQAGKVQLKEVLHVVSTSWLRYDKLGYSAASQYMPCANSKPSCVVLEWSNHKGDHSNKKMHVEW